MQQRITELERAEESRRNSSPDGRDATFTSSILTSKYDHPASNGQPLFGDNYGSRLSAGTGSTPYGRQSVRVPSAVPILIDSSRPQPAPEIDPYSFIASSHTSRTQNHTTTNASSGFEPEDNSLDRGEKLPPNDEIGVVAPRFGYYGDSSALTFMSQVRSVLDNVEDGSGDCETESSSPAPPPVVPEFAKEFQDSHQTKRFASSQRAVDMQLYALPSREHADVLVEGFWTWVHSLYPYLDRADFLERYEKIWLASKTANGTRQPEQPSSSHAAHTGERIVTFERGDKKTFYCTLNIVFALSCQFDPSLNPSGSRMSDVFWKRAKTLIEQDFNIFNEGNVPLIQTLLLFGAYMQSTELSGGCWLVASAATSVAQINGLHQVHSEMFTGTMSQKELNLRRRVWGGCILLDRYVLVKCEQIDIATPVFEICLSANLPTNADHYP